MIHQRRAERSVVAPGAGDAAGPGVPDFDPVNQVRFVLAAGTPAPDLRGTPDP